MRRFVRAILVGTTLAGGVIVLGAPPAGAVDAATDAEFRAAFADVNETEINLTADITMDCVSGGFLRNSATVLVINGDNHKIDATGCGVQLMLQLGAGLLTLNNVTLTGGAYSFSASIGGGGLQSNGDVTLVNSTVSGNAVTNTSTGAGTAATGGGLLVPGTLMLINSTVSGNQTSCPACTGTSSASAAGIAGGTMVLTNSTVSNNTASNAPNTFGGGIAGSNLTLVYSTLADNTAATGANVGGVAITSFGSVVALPQNGMNCGSLSAPTASNGFNFSDDTSCSFTDATDSENAGSPQLGALASNGGPTQTRLPQSGSPLIDKIPTGSCNFNGVTTDQRGVTRPQGSLCDIGAVEVAAPAPPTTSPPVCPAAALPAISSGTLAGAEGVVAVVPLGIQALFRRRRRGAPRPSGGRARSLVTWVLVAGVAVAMLAACAPIKPPGTTPGC